MKALVTYPATYSKEKIKLIEIPVPKKKRGEVLIKTIYTGICKTDEEIVKGFYGTPPKNSDYLIIQHEAVGKVIKGDEGGIYKPGHIVVPTVRRSCGKCEACKKGRSDYCLTGAFKERGIKGLHGFGAEYFIEDPEYLIKVGGVSEEEAVLAEPLSIIYKALERISYDWQFFKNFLLTEKTLIIGIGTIGQLCARALEKSSGFDIYTTDIVNPQSKKAKLVPGHYIQVKKNSLGNVRKYTKNYELIFEAAGAASIFKNVISEEILSPNGILLLMGIAQTSKRYSLSSIHREIVLKNQSVIGVVNSAIPHFKKALKEMRRGLKVKSLITGIYKYEDFKKALKDFKKPDSIKILLKW